MFSMHIVSVLVNYILQPSIYDPIIEQSIVVGFECLVDLVSQKALNYFARLKNL